MAAPSVAYTWGTTAEERDLPFPGGLALGPRTRRLWRGVDVAAPAAGVFRWLCQLRVAPYSYDWIDNGGRRSPQVLTPGLESLERGQSFLIFRLRDFETGAWILLETPSGGAGERIFGRVAIVYWARPVAPDRTRLLVQLDFDPAAGAWGRAMGALLPWGDLVMMRRQLLNLKRLAETSR